MPRPYVVGWYHAFKTLYDWKKQHGWKVVWRRRHMWKQMVKKRYYWMTPEERVEKVQQALDALREIGRSIHRTHEELGIKVSSCGWCNPHATSVDDEYDEEVGA